MKDDGRIPPGLALALSGLAAAAWKNMAMAKPFPLC
jgi:hypothetical protein